jgi:hypothetical protein
MGFGFGGLEAQFMCLVLVNDICDAFNLPNLLSLEEVLPQCKSLGQNENYVLLHVAITLYKCMNSQESCSLCKFSLVIKVICKVVTLSLGLLESQLFCFVKFSFLV